jgi:hypothetical protein
MTLQERHDLANDFLVSPARSDPPRALGPDTFDFQEPLWNLLNDLKHLLIEGFHQPLRKGRSNPLDETRAKVFLHAFGGSRCGYMHQDGTELESVLAVIFPRATGLNVFSGRYRRRRAQHRDKIAPTASLDAKNTKATVRIMERDAFDQTGQRLALVRWFRSRGLHFKPAEASFTL